MNKLPHNTNQTVDMNYIVPGLALFSTSEYRLAGILSRFIEFCITCTERLARRATRI